MLITVENIDNFLDHLECDKLNGLLFLRCEVNLPPSHSFGLQNEPEYASVNCVLATPTHHIKFNTRVKQEELEKVEQKITARAKELKIPIRHIHPKNESITF